MRVMFHSRNPTREIVRDAIEAQVRAGRLPNATDEILIELRRCWARDKNWHYLFNVAALMSVEILLACLTIVVLDLKLGWLENRMFAGSIALFLLAPGIRAWKLRRELQS